jgi:hypothetical protein
VDMTLVRMPDGTRRVIASSPNGDIKPGASVDIPVENAAPQKVLHHAIGIRYALSTDGSRAYGPAYDYDAGFLRMSGDLCYARYRTVDRAEWILGTAIKIRF